MHETTVGYSSDFMSVILKSLFGNIVLRRPHTSQVTFPHSDVDNYAMATSAFLPFWAEMKGSIKFTKRTTASISALGCIVGARWEYQSVGRTNVGGEIVYWSQDLERSAQHSTGIFKKK